MDEGLENITHFFVCSFSKDGNELSQWRAYADDGRGYAMGFDAHLLEQSFGKSAASTNWGSMTFRVTYDDAELSRLQKELLKVILARVRDLVKLAPQIGRRFLAQLSIRFAIQSIRASLYFKHTAYKNECEYRFLQLHQKYDALTGIQTRCRPYRLVRYMEFPWRDMALDSLKEIVVGPAAEKIVAQQFARDCLKVFIPSKSDLKINQSDIPYRGR